MSTRSGTFAMCGEVPDMVKVLVVDEVAMPSMNGQRDKPLLFEDMAAYLARDRTRQ